MWQASRRRRAGVAHYRFRRRLKEYLFCTQLTPSCQEYLHAPAVERTRQQLESSALTYTSRVVASGAVHVCICSAGWGGARGGHRDAVNPELHIQEDPSGCDGQDLHRQCDAGVWCAPSALYFLYVNRNNLMRKLLCFHTCPTMLLYNACGRAAELMSRARQNDSSIMLTITGMGQPVLKSRAGGAIQPQQHSHTLPHARRAVQHTHACVQASGWRI